MIAYIKQSGDRAFSAATSQPNTKESDMQDKILCNVQVKTVSGEVITIQRMAVCPMFAIDDFNRQ